MCLVEPNGLVPASVCIALHLGSKNAWRQFEIIAGYCAAFYPFLGSLSCKCDAGTDVKPFLWYGTQGPRDILYLPPGFISCEKVMNDVPVLGIKVTPFPAKVSGLAELLKSFGQEGEAVPKAMLGAFAKCTADSVE